MEETHLSLSLDEADPREIGELPDPKREFIAKLLGKPPGTSRHCSPQHRGQERLWLRLCISTTITCLLWLTGIWLQLSRSLCMWLAWGVKLSSKPAPGNEAAKATLGMILKNGFQIGGGSLVALCTHHLEICKDLPKSGGRQTELHQSAAQIWVHHVAKVIATENSKMVIRRIWMLRTLLKRGTRAWLHLSDPREALAELETFAGHRNLRKI